jgi:hypothetical protein
MNVWVVQDWNCYEGTLVGVFSTKEKAKESIDFFNKKLKRAENSFYIKEIGIDYLFEEYKGY